MLNETGLPPSRSPGQTECRMVPQGAEEGRKRAERTAVSPRGSKHGQRSPGSEQQEKWRKAGEGLWEGEVCARKRAAQRLHKQMLMSQLAYIHQTMYNKCAITVRKKKKKHAR